MSIIRLLYKKETAIKPKRNRALVFSLFLVFALLLGVTDLITGYELSFFAFYFLPIGLSAWILGRGASVIISVWSALVWSLADILSGHIHSSYYFTVWNALIRLASFLAISWSISAIAQLLSAEQKTTETLRKSLAEIKVLHGLLPICCQCKKIRTDQGAWQQMEQYISTHSDTQFSHGYCPECYKKALVDAGLTDESEIPDLEATLIQSLEQRGTSTTA
ncbi:MAG: hypothetical protein PHP44_13800 [Kiritimatiellae bacterium]|nr:hypothetical protein [Kiritimatiellia bacterium]